MGSGLGGTGETAGRWTEYDKLVNSGERAAAEVFLQAASIGEKVIQ